MAQYFFEKCSVFGQIWLRQFLKISLHYLTKPYPTNLPEPNIRALALLGATVKMSKVTKFFSKNLVRSLNLTFFKIYFKKRDYLQTEKLWTGKKFELFWRTYQNLPKFIPNSSRTIMIDAPHSFWQEKSN